MPFAELRGQRLYFEDSGGEGPPILLSHGFLMDHEMFAPQRDALTDVYRIITWDERGFGASEFDGQDFTYWDLAADALALLDHLGIERAVLGGMSQGGFLSLRAALLSPDRVRGLILIDTQSGTEDPEQAAAYQGLVDHWVANGYDEDIASFVSGLIIGDPDLEPAWRAKWQAWEDARLPFAARCLLGRDDVTERLPEIDVPALVVHGGDDQAIPPERGRALCDGLPDCRGYVEVAGAAHAANLSHPEPVNAAIRDFLRSLPA